MCYLFDRHSFFDDQPLQHIFLLAAYAVVFFRSATPHQFKFDYSNSLFIIFGKSSKLNPALFSTYPQN